MFQDCFCFLPSSKFQSTGLIICDVFLYVQYGVIINVTRTSWVYRGIKRVMGIVDFTVSQCLYVEYHREHSTTDRKWNEWTSKNWLIFQNMDDAFPAFKTIQQTAENGVLISSKSPLVPKKWLLPMIKTVVYPMRLIQWCIFSNILNLL